MDIRRHIYFLVFQVICLAAVKAQIVSPVYPDLHYIDDTSSRHTLDIFISPGTVLPAPCVVFIHGGGFNTGEKGRALPSTAWPANKTFCDSLYYNGYIIADINYRLSTDTIFPGPVHDCKTVIRFLKHYADSFGIDTCRIGVMGESAGGYFADMLGVSAGTDHLEGAHFGYNDVSSRVHAVLSIYGASDFNYFDGYYPNIPPDTCLYYPQMYSNPNSQASKFIGCAAVSCPARVDSVNVRSYIHGDEPPFALYHGTQDCLVPYIQSQLLYDSLIASGVDATLELSPNATHGDAVFSSPVAKQKILQYFNAKLNGSACGQATRPNTAVKTNRIKIYPNPVGSTLTIEGLGFTNGTAFEINIFDSYGRLLYTRDIYTAGSAIDLGHLEKGLYVLQLREVSHENIYTRKFIKY